MWFAITARPVKRNRKDKTKEFYSREFDVILSTSTKKELEIKLNETKVKFPQEMSKYLKAGIKIVEARNIAEAKRISKQTLIYFDERGQYHFL